MVILHFPRCSLQFLNELGGVDQVDAFEVYCEFNQGCLMFYLQYEKKNGFIMEKNIECDETYFLSRLQEDTLCFYLGRIPDPRVHLYF